MCVWGLCPCVALVTATWMVSVAFMIVGVLSNWFEYAEVCLQQDTNVM